MLTNTQVLIASVRAEGERAKIVLRRDFCDESMALGGPAREATHRLWRTERGVSET
jgi:hypothetical protein